MARSECREILAIATPFAPRATLDAPIIHQYFQAVSALQQVEQIVLKLSAQEQEELHDWLENILEDRLEMTDEFKAEIEAGKADIAAGRVRVRKP
jgi:hypothetical protein